MIEMELEVKVIPWVMVDIIPIDMVVDVVVLLMILTEVFQIVPLPLNLGDDIIYDQHAKQHNQFEQSMMIAMNNSLIDLLKCQQRL